MYNPLIDSQQVHTRNRHPGGGVPLSHRGEYWQSSITSESSSDSRMRFISTSLSAALRFACTGVALRWWIVQTHTVVH